MIAALFVAKGGAYYGLPDVDPWDEARDARKYAGPWPVVAHPPCDRWGRYWGGGPSANKPRLLGDDSGCFDRALWAVRSFGGVLEHPEASHAWRWFGLALPPFHGGWIKADAWGWSCCMSQGRYGHRARKMTWLYAVGVELPSLPWGPADGERLDEGFHSAEERRAAREAGQKPRPRLSTAENIATPPAFRDLLISIARTAAPPPPLGGCGRSREMKVVVALLAVIGAVTVTAWLDTALPPSLVLVWRLVANLAGAASLSLLVYLSWRLRRATIGEISRAIREIEARHAATTPPPEPRR